MALTRVVLGTLGLVLAACPWSRTGEWDEARCVPECAAQGKVCHWGECVPLADGGRPVDANADGVAPDGPRGPDGPADAGQRREGTRDVVVIAVEGGASDGGSTEKRPPDVAVGAKDSQVKRTCEETWQCFQSCWDPAATGAVTNCLAACRAKACDSTADTRAVSLYQCARTQCGCECGVLANSACFVLPQCGSCLASKCPVRVEDCSNYVCSPASPG